VSVAGWLVALALTLLAGHVDRRARRRAELVARACHELRGPLTAAGLALHSAGRETFARPLAAVELQLRRAQLALIDLSLAPAVRGITSRRSPSPSCSPSSPARGARSPARTAVTW
jgi:signal transduction histidine kinase